ncbi:MAG: hypothetical protein COB30_001515 [Ectothiorhodospiraceae bacterium]|nr:hypothetical protein [Ectothiorhodospiraceae bacterium]
MTEKFNYQCSFIKQLLALVVAAAIVPAISFSASSHQMGLDDLVKHADHIVVGKVANVRSEWANDKIYSLSTIVVTDNIKGNVASSYVITTLGGTAFHPRLKAEVTMDVSGGLYFSKNEDVILFTKQNNIGNHQVVGMSQGKFNIVSEKDSGEKMVPVASKKIYSQKLTKDLLTPESKSTSNDKSGDRTALAGDQLVIKKGTITLADFVTKIRTRINNQKNKLQK